MLLKGATLLHTRPARVQAADVRVEGGLVTEVGALSAHEGEETVDLSGKWLLPGLVVGHHHLYSALSGGMPMPAEEPANFADMLARVWWKLDRALDPESVEVSGLVGGIGALRAGVTTIIDHHASPSFIEGSLERLDGALGTLGLRRVLCYEVTDRGGPAEAMAGLRAHEGLLSQSNEMRAVMVGAHANFTVSDDTLARVGAAAREAGIGVHIHVAEAADDRKAVGEPLVARMQRLDALLPGSILAHCVFLDQDELRAVADAGAWVSHQPRSNMNNHVGYAPLRWFGPNTMLGTDGIGADMLAEVQAGYFRAQEARVGWWPDRFLDALTAGAVVAGDKLGMKLGLIEPGAGADLVVADPVPGPPLSDRNLPGAVIFRFSAAMVRHVMVAGTWRLWERDPVGASAGEVDARAQVVAPAVWKRMSEG